VKSNVRSLSWPAAALVWACAYAVVLVTLRLLIRGVFGSATAAPLLALPCHLVEGALLGVALFRVRWAIWAVMPLVLVLIFVTAITLHYEAVLGELPTAGVIAEYLGQLGHYSSSLRSGGKPLWFALEVLVSWALLLAATLLLRGRAAPLTARRQALVPAVVVAASLVWTVVVHVHPGVAGQQNRWSARLPLMVFASHPGKRPLVSAIAPEQIAEFQKLSGLEPSGAPHPEAPLCGTSPRPVRRAPTERNVILIVLESVGMYELEARPDGDWLLPNLRRIARAGFHATRMHAVGTQTCQALPALFSGQGAQPWDVLLWRKPLPRFHGLPRELVRHGYRTAYYHGAGLSFEQKRDFLRMVGVQTLHELHNDDPEPRYGWGLADEVLFQRTRQWIEDHHRDHPDSPYMITFATLSGHHPYKLPASWNRRLGDSDQDLFHETLAYMDHHLGRFFDWYLTSERDRGTYLVIISDHAPLYDNALAVSAGRPLRFDIPLIIHGPDAVESAGWDGLEQRLASQMDLPATLGGLVGISPGPCDQGLDLLADTWPEQRIVSGVGGRALNDLYLFDGELVLRVEREQDRYTVLASPSGPDADERLRAMQRYVELMLPVTLVLLETDAYAPVTIP
jgi:phosphoglycerol transferase MdoB-like AlkP superfamily enzyme